jgi:hypothetical protein
METQGHFALLYLIAKGIFHLVPVGIALGASFDSKKALKAHLIFFKMPQDFLRLQLKLIGVRNTLVDAPTAIGSMFT